MPHHLREVADDLYCFLSWLDVVVVRRRLAVPFLHEILAYSGAISFNYIV